jgi:cell division transport system permease protein
MSKKSPTLRRIVRAGFLNFWRNAFVSFSSLLAITEALFIFGIVLFSGVVLQATLASIENQADMSVVFLTDASEESVLDVKTQLESLPEVSRVTYASREQVLATFREDHKDDQLTLQALDELGQNPFGARLTIEAKEISQYNLIADYLREQSALQTGETAVIEKINYYDPTFRLASERLQGIIASAAWLGLVMILLFTLTTVTICLNLVRLAIYTSRDEIHVMRLVGATSGFVRGPFVIQGALQGVVAGMFTLFLFYPFTYFIKDAALQFGGVDLFMYYLSHFPIFFAVFVGGGLLLGAGLHFLAVRRYLKV